MSNFMDRLMGGNKKSSPAKSAKDRLKLVLVTDRASLSPEELANMQKEILDIIRKYCGVDEDDVNLKFEQRERDNYLVADIPLSKSPRGGGSIRLETSLTSDEDEDGEEEDSDESGKAEAATPKAGEATKPAPQAEKPPPDTTQPVAEPVKPGGAPQGLSGAGAPVQEEDTQQVTPPLDPSAKEKESEDDTRKT